MKPGFALSLSFDGISLLHRAAGGWRLIGEVALDAPDLAEELAGLRALAEQLEPDGLACKLIIPNDQIRYLSLETGSASDEALTKQVRAALAGATPYAVEDLAYDIARHGETTHVAAVSRETLNEAEAFATEHDFNPVSFVAVPGDQPFLGEPFFGSSCRASDLNVSPDGIAVVVIGEATVPPPQPEQPPEPEPAPAPSVPEPVPGQGAQGFSTRRSKTAASDAPQLAAATRDVPPKPVTAPVVQAVAIAGPTIAVEPDEPARPEPVNPAVRGPAPDSVAAAVRATAEPAPRTSPVESDFDPEDETSRMTVFGARPNGEVGGKPRYLGLVLTAGLAVFLLVVAAWAAVFSDFRLLETSSDQTAPKTEERTAQDSEPVPEQSEPDAASLPEPEQPDQPDPQVSSTDAVIAPELAAQPGSGSDDIDAAALDTLYSPGNATGDPVEDEQSADEALLQGDLEAEPLPKAPVQVLDSVTEPAQPQLNQVPADEPELASLDPQVTEQPDPVTPEPETVTIPTQPLDDAALYAATGIWPQAPDQPGTPGVIGLSDLYTASIDRTDLFQDAVALPPQASLQTDSPVPEVSNPVAPENTFSLDSRGLVEPSDEGTLNPDGILVFSGRPTKVPPDTPRREEEAEPEAQAVQARLAGLRPKLRPDDLIEQNERAQLGGRSLAELANIRPRLRPANLVKPEEAEEERGPPTAQAVAASVKPKLRPARLVTKVNKERLAAASTASIQDVTSTQPVVLAPKSVTPKIPSSSSVARQATVKNTINLRKVNLIGVYGSPSNRRALVRLPSGRYKKVKIGDSVDGGRVVAIGDSELRYQKAGRNVTLKMPKS